MMRDHAILTCAISGVVANKQQCAAIPYTPEEYAAEARRAWEAGAAQVHIHARYPDGRPSYRREEYELIRSAILSEVPEILINFSTGAVGIPMEDRVAHITDLRPDVGAVNMGSMNYAKYSSKKRGFIFNFVFQNSFDDIIYLLGKMKEAGVLPEMECFDSGHISSVEPLIDMGLVSAPFRFSLIMGVLGGVKATTQNLCHQVSLLPPGSSWGVIGISRVQWPMLAAGLTLGGDVRAGLEDNFYLPSGEMASSNGALIEVAARQARDIGRRPATAAEARQILGLSPLEGAQ